MTRGATPLGLRQGTLELVPHDTKWASAFATEARSIRDALADVVFEVDHIGSTAVPGLPAKAILDIAMRAKERDEDRIAQALVGLGYIDRGFRSGRLFIRLRDVDVRTHNLHLYRLDDPEYFDQITFRDALRADAELRDKYSLLKQSLVKRLGDAGRSLYADAKTDFVRAATVKASRHE